MHMVQEQVRGNHYFKHKFIRNCCYKVKHGYYLPEEKQIGQVPLCKDSWLKMRRKCVKSAILIYYILIFKCIKNGLKCYFATLHVFKNGFY